MYRFPWYLTLVSTNHASSNPGQIGALWFRSYCPHQSISVYGTTVAELLPIQFGVPQGRFLGPLLFLPGVTKTGLANIL